MSRRRWQNLGLMALTLGVGLASRAFQDVLPVLIGLYAGDVLWALMVYFGFCVLFPRHSPYRIGMYALVFSFAIEVSQLYRADWIEAIRATRLGGLILGFSFLWSDLVCYTIGVLVGMVVDLRFNWRSPLPSTKP